MNVTSDCHARSSRRRYRRFVDDYRRGRLDVEPNEAGAASARTRGGRRQYRRAYARWLWPHRYAAAVVIALAVVRAALEMVEPLFIRFAIDRVLLNPALDTPARLHRLQIAGSLFLVVVVVSGLINFVKDYRQRLLNARVTLFLREAVFDRMLHLPLPRLWDMKAGGILSRLSGDIETTTGLMQMAIVSPAVSLVRLTLGMTMLLALNWRLAFASLVIIPSVMLMSLTLARRVRPIYRAARKDAEQVDGRVGEIFAGIRVVRAFRREVTELLSYMRGRHTILRKELFAYRRELVVWLAWTIMLSGVNVMFVWYGGYLAIMGAATIGDIMAFQWYTFLLLNPVWSIVNSFSELQRSLAAMERVVDVLHMPEDKPDRPDAMCAPAKVREIEFADVTFEYQPGRAAVREFSVRVPGRSIVALVGRSGAGKTTITDLLARFHDPTHGRILVNGIDIRDCRLASYRDLLAIVQQDVFLFDGSIRENIAYGCHPASDWEIEDAARRAHADEFIERLPDGYDTLIGERGVKLSGGQRQRLAIARAILSAPEILILDEATSNLDTESERLIQASMASLLAGRTTFVIAHRLSTIRRADLILVMKDGRIVERGTHAQLMDGRGDYYRMVIRQIEPDANAEEICR